MFVFTLVCNSDFKKDLNGKNRMGKKKKQSLTVEKIKNIINLENGIMRYNCMKVSNDKNYSVNNCSKVIEKQVNRHIAVS